MILGWFSVCEQSTRTRNYSPNYFHALGNKQPKFPFDSVTSIFPCHVGGLVLHTLWSVEVCLLWNSRFPASGSVSKSNYCCSTAFLRLKCELFQILMCSSIQFMCVGERVQGCKAYVYENSHSCADPLLLSYDCLFSQTGSLEKYICRCLCSLKTWNLIRVFCARFV